MYKDIVIVSAVRTPFGRYCGSLREYDYFDLGALPMNAVLARVNVPGDKVDEVFWGVGDTSVCKDVYTPVAARQTLIKAGLPAETPSIALDKACVSAMSAVKFGCMTMMLGEIDVAIGGGATSFSQEPLIVRGVRFDGFRFGDVKMEDPLYALGYKDFNPVSVDTDDVAYEYGIERNEQDEWAFRSHQNYGAAWNAGKFKDEIFPLEISLEKGEHFTLDIDEQYRPNSSMDSLKKLEPVYGTRAITAGNEKAFVAGADIEHMAKGDIRAAYKLTDQNMGVFERLADLPKPTIAAICGYALGGGCEVALCCDFRIAAENAILGLPEITLGIIPGAGGTQRLSRLVGIGPATELIFMGEMIKADKAEQIGLIRKVVPLDQLGIEVKALANKLMERPALALRAAKAALRKGINASLKEGLQIEQDLFCMLFGTDDQKEGMAAFLEKRKRVFKGI
jgi:acetyl-CoA acetyltransferase family protein